MKTESDELGLQMSLCQSADYTYIIHTLKTPLKKEYFHFDMYFADVRRKECIQRGRGGSFAMTVMGICSILIIKVPPNSTAHRDLLDHERIHFYQTLRILSQLFEVITKKYKQTRKIVK